MSAKLAAAIVAAGAAAAPALLGRAATSQAEEPIGSPRLTLEQEPEQLDGAHSTRRT